MIIVTCATTNYVDRLVLLLSSAVATNPGCHIRVYCPGWPTELLTKARATYPEYRFVPQPAPDDFDTTVAKNKRSGGILRSKPAWLLETYELTDRPAVWIDADTLVLKPIMPMIVRVNTNGDYGVTHRPSAHAFAKFACAVMYFTKTTAAAALLQNYARLTRINSGNGNWYHDQLALVEATKQSQAKLVSLSEAEHSIHGNIATTLLSRRPKFDTPRMYAELARRHITVRSLL
jgi:hypothetical protein